MISDLVSKVIAAEGAQASKGLAITSQGEEHHQEWGMFVSAFG